MFVLERSVALFAVFSPYTHTNRGPCKLLYHEVFCVSYCVFFYTELHNTLVCQIGANFKVLYQMYQFLKTPQNQQRFLNSSGYYMTCIGNPATPSSPKCPLSSYFVTKVHGMYRNFHRTVWGNPGSGDPGHQTPLYGLL